MTPQALIAAILIGIQPSLTNDEALARATNALERLGPITARPRTQNLSERKQATRERIGASMLKLVNENPGKYTRAGLCKLVQGSMNLKYSLLAELISEGRVNLSVGDRLLYPME